MLSAVWGFGRVKALHMRQTAKVAKSLTGTAADYFREQVRELADELEATGDVNLGFFDAAAWDAKLKDDLRPILGRAYLTGAASEYALLDSLKAMQLPWAKTTASEAAELYGIDVAGLSLEMPPELIERIIAAVEGSFAEPYWAGIQQTTRDYLQSVIEEGSTEGLSIRAIAKKIEAGAFNYGRTRAVTIARTESSRALNAGHTIGIQELAAESGLPLGKEWLSILGPTTRQSHADADAQQAPADGTFLVGGHACQYPGDAALPVEEVANCQCTVLSSALAERLREG